MIKLSEKRNELMNVGHTIETLRRLQQMIDHYSDDKPGPVYIMLEYYPNTDKNMQIDRKFFITALQAQRQKLVDYLATLGIEAD